MRSAHPIQPALPLALVPHKHAKKLAAIAHILDGLPQLEAQVLDDLVPPQVRRDTGRDGLSAQQVLRTLVLYLMLQVDFEQLEFHLADSPTYRAFCLLGLGDEAPKRACLQQNISCIRPQTLKALHQILVEQAVHRGVESGHAVRIDTTPVLAPVRPPLDSQLLADAVRVLLRLLRRAQKLAPALPIPNHQRRTSRRSSALRTEKLDEDTRKALYFDLVQDTKRYVEAALLAADFLDGVAGSKAALLSLQLRTQAESALCICDQTERRVLEGQPVPALEKRVSMFETHADTLRKRDQVLFGHKVLVSFGKTGVVLGAQILSGNPADATLAQSAVEQVMQNTGRVPHDTAMDLGFAAQENVRVLKSLGVQRVAFPKGRGIDAQRACGSRRVQRKLYRFRAGVEGMISWLKRSLGMGRSRWKGEQGFGAYVWGVVLTASLQALAADS